MEAIDILKVAAQALDSKKAVDMQAIHVEDLTIITDYFLIASGTSSTQVKALADEVEERLHLAGVEPHHVEGKSSSWILLDYNTVVVHVFYKEARDFYSLERLWQDGKIIELDTLLASNESQPNESRFTLEV